MAAAAKKPSLTVVDGTDKTRRPKARPARKQAGRAAKPAEPERRKHTVATAAAEGTKLDLLIATRDRVAKAIDSDKCPPRDLAALTKRLGDIVEEIQTLEVTAKKDRDADSDPDDDEEDDDSFDPSSI